MPKEECENCEEMFAVLLDCEECGRMCEQCDRILHKAPAMKNHKRERREFEACDDTPLDTSDSSENSKNRMGDAKTKVKNVWNHILNKMRVSSGNDSRMDGALRWEMDAELDSGHPNPKDVLSTVLFTSTVYEKKSEKFCIDVTTPSGTNAIAYIDFQLSASALSAFPQAELNTLLEQITSKAKSVHPDVIGYSGETVVLEDGTSVYRVFVFYHHDLVEKTKSGNFGKILQCLPYIRNVIFELKLLETPKALMTESVNVLRYLKSVNVKVEISQEHATAANAKNLPESAQQFLEPAIKLFEKGLIIPSTTLSGGVKFVLDTNALCQFTTDEEVIALIQDIKDKVKTLSSPKICHSAFTGIRNIVAISKSAEIKCTMTSAVPLMSWTSIGPLFFL